MIFGSALMIGAPPAGEVVVTTQETDILWAVPAGVFEVSALVVEGGQGSSRRYGGSGGRLRWLNQIAVTPGETLTLRAGGPGDGLDVEDTNGGGLGGESSIRRDGVVILSSSDDLPFVNGGGGDGGPGGSSANLIALPEFGPESLPTGGGGAGGYTGDGGAGGDGDEDNNGASPGAGGAASGGRGAFQAQELTSRYRTLGADSGGGTGIFGQTNNGTPSGGGGSDGEDGEGGSAGAGRFGGGGAPREIGVSKIDGNRTYFPTDGAGGAVRLIWGAGRMFPATRTMEIAPAEQI